METYGEVGSGGNSGFQAVNLAVQFGPPRKILLAGFDFRLDFGSHWHGNHGRGLQNPKQMHMAHWRRSLDDAAVILKALGVTVINVSAISTLTAYPVMTLEDALADVE